MLNELLVSQFKRLSRELRDTLDGLDEAQLNHAPGGNAMTIGHNAWHVFRTMDNIVNFALQRKQPVWLEDGYMERFGLPKNAQGTGMELEEAQAITIHDADLLREYGTKVLASCRDYMESVTSDELNEIALVRPLGEMPRWRVLAEVINTHCSQHLGEMSMGRGLLGLRGAAEPVLD